MRLSSRIIIALVFFSQSCICILQAQTHSTTFGIFYDQDYTLEKVGLKNLNEDRNYTMGLGFYYSSDSMQKWIIYKPHDWIFKKLNPGVTGETGNVSSLMLANGSFTPDSLATSEPIFNDRPYASLTYLQANRNYVINEYGRHKMYGISLSIGIIGSYISRELQTAVHNSMNDNDTKSPRTPRGWNNQVSSGGAPSLLFGYQQDYLLTTKPIDNRHLDPSLPVRRFGGEWKAGWKANIGWYNMLGAELTYRFGWIDPRTWSYLTNPLGSSSKAAPNTASLFYSKPRKTEIFLFNTIRTNLVAYNVLLSGQGGADPVTIPNKWVRRAVLENTSGFSLSPVIYSRFILDLKGKFNLRSPEFHAPGRKPRWHYWAGIELLLTVLR